MAVGELARSKNHSRNLSPGWRSLGREPVLTNEGALPRFYKALGAGIPCTLGVTFVDGLVLARSAFHHSVNYRSVVAFGECVELTGAEEKMEAFRYFTDAIVPGRFAECRTMQAREAEVTGVLSFRISAASAKVRTGGPKDDPADYTEAIWAGVVPYTTSYGAVEPDESGVPGLGLPDSVIRLLED